MITDSVPPPRGALISRALDFWLLGGASILVFLCMTLSAGYRSLDAVGNHFRDIVGTMALLQLVVNYPHFLASYHLAYFRGAAFVRKHWFQTVAVPLLLAFLILWSLWLMNGQEDRATTLLSVLINGMYLTVGWHYTKQAFGVTMVYAAFDRYPLTPRQRTLIRYSLLALWWHSFAWAAYGGPTDKLWGLTYKIWRLPTWTVKVTGLVTGVLLLLVFRLVVVNWRAGRKPSLNLVTPYVAMFVWFAPWFRQPEYYIYAVPFFHSLQYLVFVYRVEKYRGKTSHELWGSAIALGLVLAGWLSFEVIPGAMDSLTFPGQSVSFFLLTALIFINVHHYFLDNVLWRVRDDPEVRAALIGP